MRRIRPAGLLGDGSVGRPALFDGRLDVPVDERRIALVQHHRRAVPEGPAARVGEAEPVLAGLLQHHDELEGGQAAAAVSGRGVQAPQPRRAGLGAQPGQPVVGDTGGPGADLRLYLPEPLRDEAPRDIPHHKQLVRKIEPVERHRAHLSCGRAGESPRARSDNPFYHLSIMKSAYDEESHR
jgi:hypothetical protein